MKKLFSILTFIICLSSVFNVNASQYDGSYDRPCNGQCVGQCVDPCVGQCDSSCGRFYVGGFGGADWVNIDRLEKHYDVKSNVGFTGGASLGYKFNNGFRVEGEVAYRRNSLDGKHHVKGYSSESDHHRPHGSMHAWTYMGNVLYDFDQVSEYIPNVVPYVGVGAGYIQDEITIKQKHKEDSHCKITGKGFAYQGIAGVGYRLTDDTTLSVEYRYLGGQTHAKNHGLVFGVRQSF